MPPRLSCPQLANCTDYTLSDRILIYTAVKTWKFAPLLLVTHLYVTGCWDWVKMGVRFTAYMMIPVAVSANDRKYSAWNCQHKFGKFTHASNQHCLCQPSKQTEYTGCSICMVPQINNTWKVTLTIIMSVIVCVCVCETLWFSHCEKCRDWGYSGRYSGLRERKWQETGENCKWVASLFVLPTKYYSGVQTRENDMGRACGTCTAVVVGTPHRDYM